MGFCHVPHHEQVTRRALPRNSATAPGRLELPHHSCSADCRWEFCLWPVLLHVHRGSGSYALAGKVVACISIGEGVTMPLLRTPFRPDGPRISLGRHSDTKRAVRDPAGLVHVAGFRTTRAGIGCRSSYSINHARGTRTLPTTGSGSRRSHALRPGHHRPRTHMDRRPGDCDDPCSIG